MAYAIQTAFKALKPYLELNPQDRDQKIDDLVAPVVNKLKNRNIPFCTTLVVDDTIVQKLFEPERFLKKPEIRYMPNRYRELLMSGKEKHQRQFRGGGRNLRLSNTRWIKNCCPVLKKPVLTYSCLQTPGQVGWASYRDSPFMMNSEY